MSIRAKVYDFVAGRGKQGASDAEIRKALDEPKGQVTRSLNELKHDGLLERTGDVWLACPRGCGCMMPF